MEILSQILLGVFSFFKPSTNVGYCEVPTSKSSEVLSLLIKPDMCLRDESPSWKYLYKLMDYYQIVLHTVLIYYSLVSEQFITVKHVLAGWREQLHAHYELCSNILMNDQLFLFIFKFLTLFLFWYVMHWLKNNSTSTSSIESPRSLTGLHKKKSSGCLPQNNPDKALIPKNIICEFEFKTPTELHAEAESLNSIMLDMEERKRRKRFCKKRKCVSAGPVLIHLKKTKKHKNFIPQPLIAAVLPPKEDLNHYLPLRSKPLIVGSTKTEAVKVNNGIMDLEEMEMAYMCVYTL